MWIKCKDNVTWQFLYKLKNSVTVPIRFRSPIHIETNFQASCETHLAQSIIIIISRNWRGKIAIKVKQHTHTHIDLFKKMMIFRFTFYFLFIVVLEIVFDLKMHAHWGVGAYDRESEPPNEQHIIVWASTKTSLSVSCALVIQTDAEQRHTLACT